MLRDVLHWKWRDVVEEDTKGVSVSDETHLDQEFRKRDRKEDDLKIRRSMDVPNKEWMEFENKFTL